MLLHLCVAFAALTTAESIYVAGQGFGGGWVYDTYYQQYVPVIPFPQYSHQAQSPPREVCQYSRWSEWGACSVTCGWGTTQRIRELTAGRATQCKEELKISKQCIPKQCGLASREEKLFRKTLKKSCSKTASACQSTFHTQIVANQTRATLVNYLAIGLGFKKAIDQVKAIAKAKGEFWKWIGLPNREADDGSMWGDLIMDKKQAKGVAKYYRRLRYEQNSRRRKRSIFASIKDSGTPVHQWNTNGTHIEVFVRFDASIRGVMSKQREDIIAAAMEEIRSKTCIQFRPADDSKQTEVLLFSGPLNSDHSACYGDLGRKIDGPTRIWLAPGCFRKGFIVHELLHTLGVHHEHQRPDRSSHIKIHMDRVQNGGQSAFSVLPGASFATTHGLDYDPVSIMHYWPTDFAKYELFPVIEPADGKSPIGPLDEGLTDHDAKGLNLAYKCNV